MPKSNQLTSTKNIILAAGLAVLTSAMLVIGLIANTVSAAGSVTISSNVAAVPAENLTITVQVQDAPNVVELEVDHSLEAFYPQFSVYADEADPYGGDEASFTAAGMSVTYSAATGTWVINFGSVITNDIIVNRGGVIEFYFALKDSSGTPVYGDMMDGDNLSNFTMTLDLDQGTGENLSGEVEVPEADDNDEAVIPGVPNTSLAL